MDSFPGIGPISDNPSYLSADMAILSCWANPCVGRRGDGEKYVELYVFLKTTSPTLAGRFALKATSDITRGL
jgi:hypothetical protein